MNAVSSALQAPTAVESVNSEAQRTLIILGMHRSGTSALTGSLEAAGVYLGTTNHSTADNVKGNRESRRIMILQNDLLLRNGGSWFEPVCNLKWEPIHLVTRDLIIESYKQSSVWGFKDPRTLFTLDGWLDAIPHAELVGVFRHPFFVAESLLRRNDMSHELGLNLWISYNQKLLEYLEIGNTFPLIEFSDDCAEFTGQLKSLSSQLKLTDPSKPFFDSTLRQQTLPNVQNSDTVEKAITLYEKLRTLRLES